MTPPGRRLRRPWPPPRPVVIESSCGTAIPLDNESWGALRDVRRQRIEIVAIRRDELEADRRELGSLAHVATTTGRLVYGH